MATATEASQQANRSGLDPKRLVVIFYLLATIIVALFLDHLLSQVWARFAWPNPRLIEGLDESSLTTLLGFALAIGAAVGAYLHPVTHALSLEVATELMKVTWPSWDETRSSTVAVVVASLVASVLIFFIDTVAYKLMVDWIPALWGKL